MKSILTLLVLLIGVYGHAEEDSYTIQCSKGNRPENYVGFKLSSNGDINLNYGESGITFKSNQYSQVNGTDFEGKMDSNLFVAINQEVQGQFEGSDFTVKASFSFTYSPMQKAGYLTLIESGVDRKNNPVQRTIHRNVLITKCK